MFQTLICYGTKWQSKGLLGLRPPGAEPELGVGLRAHLNVLTSQTSVLQPTSWTWQVLSLEYR